MRSDAVSVVACSARARGSAVASSTLKPFWLWGRAPARAISAARRNSASPGACPTSAASAVGDAPGPRADAAEREARRRHPPSATATDHRGRHQRELVGRPVAKLEIGRARAAGPAAAG